ncbi:hypothetical protein BSU04_14630 [Caballeronia sordidicola]|uniref:Uncharacterized protein n=1 Tax=Caballeronia sordidicola TaxID=196367 RepID=A0A226X458_CABSO|nr:hypothetical protein BSU04_14630 [Caballeronia sordidicola]
MCIANSEYSHAACFRPEAPICIYMINKEFISHQTDRLYCFKRN